LNVWTWKGAKPYKGFRFGNESEKLLGDGNSKVRAIRVATVSRSVKHVRGVAMKVAASRAVEAP